MLTNINNNKFDFGIPHPTTKVTLAQRSWLHVWVVVFARAIGSAGSRLHADFVVDFDFVVGVVVVVIIMRSSWSVAVIVANRCQRFGR